MTVTAVVDPESLGVDVGRLAELRSRVRREIDSGLLPSCQFALARDGKLAAFETVGAADPDAQYVIFSATKAFVASAAWQLIGEGRLDIGRPVAEYIPEFGTNGKDLVTVEQVMLHTSGFPRAPLGPPAWADRDRRLEAFARWRLNWEPGTAHEYHPTSAHWVLAELIERIDGRDYRDVVHERVTGALGLPRVLGIPPDDQDDIAELSLCGEPAGVEAVQGAVECSNRDPAYTNPKTGSHAPRSVPASSEIRNATIAAATSGATHRVKSASGMARRFAGVSSTEGAHTLAVTPEPQHSSAITSANVATPSLATA